MYEYDCPLCGETYTRDWVGETFCRCRQPSEGDMADQWARVILEGKTVALVKLPLAISSAAGIAQAWPKSSLSASKPLGETFRDMATEGEPFPDYAEDEGE